MGLREFPAGAPARALTSNPRSWREGRQQEYRVAYRGVLS